MTAPDDAPKKERAKLTAHDLDDLTNPDLEHLELAKTGIMGPLARYIEEGGPLHEETRRWIAAFFRDELPPKKPGEKRRPKKAQDDYRIWKAVLDEMKVSGGGPSKAQQVVAKSLERNFSTVRDAYDRINKSVEIAIGLRPDDGDG
jgi:hypothetical protein